MTVQHDVPRMPYDVSGSGAALALLPGALTGWLSWIPHAEALSASRRVVRLQLLNVALGLAGVPLPPAYSMDYEIAAFGSALDELEIAQADLAGWSYGAGIALSYAIHHPDRVRSLTLIEPPAFWVARSRGPLSEDMLDEQRLMELFAADDVSEAQLLRFIRFVRIVPDGIDPRTVPQWPIWYEHRQSLRMRSADLRHEDSIERVRAFDKPVLLVTGEGSIPSALAITDMLDEEFPNARRVSFPGGHAPHIVSMQPFLDTFTRFLADAHRAA